MSHQPPINGMLRPAGGGIHVVSTGVAALRRLQQEVYGVESEVDIVRSWEAALNDSAQRVCMLGVPSDVGAGFRKGSNHGPNAIRQRLISLPNSQYHTPEVVDLGDVFCVPHLLSEEMLSATQRSRCQVAIYSRSDAHESWPVSPLGLTYAALMNRYAFAKGEAVPKPIVVGGDHSIGWPAFKAAYDFWEVEKGERLGLLHFDAHTDLLASRLGVDYCFATWAYHANELLARDGRLYQVGIRTSGRTKAHWESTLNVNQMWADEANALSAKDAAAMVIERFESLGVTRLYISNDIDGTDPKWAPATGTPEPNGLHPDWVSELTLRLGERFPLVGADLVEVAPLLAAEDSEALNVTLDTSVRYLEDFMTLML